MGRADQCHPVFTARTKACPLRRESYRSSSFVRKGIFRFTRNGMYVYGFLLLWVPALWFASLAALAVALFNHLYIWVHYFATERPDMERIYGRAPAAT